MTNERAARLRAEAKERVKKVEAVGRAFRSHVQNLGYSRELDNAMDKIDEAVLWAVKHLIRA